MHCVVLIAFIVSLEHTLTHTHTHTHTHTSSGVLFGQWGFAERPSHYQSTTVLIWGPSGSGKSVTAEAIGFEIGRPLKVGRVWCLAILMSDNGDRQ